MGQPGCDGKEGWSRGRIKNDIKGEKKESGVRTILKVIKEAEVSVTLKAIGRKALVWATLVAIGREAGA